MNCERDNASGRFVSAGPQPWQIFMEKHTCVKEWLEIRPLGTQAQYCRKLISFCRETEVSPEEFLGLDRFEARDIVWMFVKPFIKESTSKAKSNLGALKSFYRSKDGEQLPFDSRRGGKHYFNDKRRKKAALEHVPDRAEIYRIIDSATNIRDKTMLLLLFQSGVRKNVLSHLKFKDVKPQLYPKIRIPLRLRITDQIDLKLQGYAIQFYDTFLQGEAVQELRAYCDTYHKDMNPEKPLFYTKLDNPMGGERVWEIVKQCVSRAGLDPATIWVHTLRRAFKRVVRHTGLDDDFKEAIMGHVLRDSRENYFSRNEPGEIEQEYMKIDFGREVPESKVQKQTKQIEKQAERIRILEVMSQMKEGRLEAVRKAYNLVGKDAIDAMETASQLMKQVKEQAKLIRELTEKVEGLIKKS